MTYISASLTNPTTYEAFQTDFNEHVNHCGTTHQLTTSTTYVLVTALDILYHALTLLQHSSGSRASGTLQETHDDVTFDTSQCVARQPRRCRLRWESSILDRYTALLINNFFSGNGLRKRIAVACFGMLRVWHDYFKRDGWEGHDYFKRDG